MCFRSYWKQYILNCHLYNKEPEESKNNLTLTYPCTIFTLRADFNEDFRSLGSQTINQKGNDQRNSQALFICILPGTTLQILFEILAANVIHTFKHVLFFFS